MKKLLRFMEIFDVSEEDALQSILTSISPMPPSTTKQNWTRLSTFGNDSPSTSELWKKLLDSDFRCVDCKSQIRLTFHHINKDSKNNLINNIEVLCFNCNRKKSRKKTINFNHKYELIMRAIEIWEKTGKFPSQKQLKEILKVQEIGCVTYSLKFAESRLEKFLLRKNNLQN